MPSRFKCEQTTGDMGCLAVNQALGWVKPIGVPTRQQAESSTRELAEHLIRYVVNQLKPTAGESGLVDGALRPTVIASVGELTHDYRIRAGTLGVFERLGVSRKMLLDSTEPIALLTPYQQRFGVELWHLEQRKPTMREVFLRRVEMNGLRFGTYEVLKQEAYDVHNFEESSWRCVCDCKKWKIIKGKNLLSGDFAPCDSLPLVDSLLKHGDLSMSEVRRFVANDAHKARVDEREAHIADIKVNHPLVGKRFGAWLVLYFDGWRDRNPYWFCRCQCGASKGVRQRALIDGDSKSCGHCNYNVVAQAFLAVTGSKVLPHT